MKLTVAAFDFDGTLTTRDTFQAFVRQNSSGAGYAANLFLSTPKLILYAGGLAPNETHKMDVFARRFQGMPEAEFVGRARTFSLQSVPSLLRDAAIARLQFHHSQGHTIVIVSASLDAWIRPWAASVGIEHVLSSQAGIAHGKLTGGLLGPNCHGSEKVRRLTELFPDRSAYTLHAYGDSSGDRQLLEFADHAYYRRFG
jgi:phosphatidylglycerophosphatase C